MGEDLAVGLVEVVVVVEGPVAAGEFLAVVAVVEDQLVADCHGADVASLRQLVEVGVVQILWAWVVGQNSLGVGAFRVYPVAFHS